jgi:hypothetical protein
MQGPVDTSLPPSDRSIMSMFEPMTNGPEQVNRVQAYPLLNRSTILPVSRSKTWPSPPEALEKT